MVTQLQRTRRLFTAEWRARGASMQQIGRELIVREDLVRSWVHTRSRI